MYYRIRTEKITKLEVSAIKLAMLADCKTVRLNRCITGYCKKDVDYLFVFKNRFGRGVCIIHNNPISSYFGYIDYLIFDSLTQVYQSLNRLNAFELIDWSVPYKYKDLENRIFIIHKALEAVYEN